MFSTTGQLTRLHIRIIRMCILIPTTLILIACAGNATAPVQVEGPSQVDVTHTVEVTQVVEVTKPIFK